MAQAVQSLNWMDGSVLLIRGRAIIQKQTKQMYMRIVFDVICKIYWTELKNQSIMIFRNKVYLRISISFISQVCLHILQY